MNETTTLTYADVHPLIADAFRKIHSEEEPPLGSSVMDYPHRLTHFALCSLAEAIIKSKGAVNVPTIWNEELQRFAEILAEKAAPWPSDVPVRLEDHSEASHDAVLGFHDKVVALLDAPAPYFATM